MHPDKHIAKMIIKHTTAMPGAVAAWLVFSKLKDDSRALELSVWMDFRMNGPARTFEWSGYRLRCCKS